MGVIVPCPSMKDKILARQFGATIRRLRQEKGISQERFAVLSRIHRTYMGSIERGEKTVTIETANKIAKALDLPMSRLFIEMEVELESGVMPT
jgi:transcriptional regulator with XRE-family HTH domain